jgi:hypothetical protein
MRASRFAAIRLGARVLRRSPLTCQASGQTASPRSTASSRRQASTGRCAAAIVLLLLLTASCWAVEKAVQPSPLPYARGSWTLVLLPDTQNYCSSFPEIFTSQTRWIVDNKQKRDIGFVLQEGDVTNNNAPEEWENGRRSMSLLDGVVPYAIAPGNHDYISKDQSERQSKLSTYFPVSLFANLPTFGGVYERGKMENSYHLFSAGGRDWLVIALEWGPRDPALNWAGMVLDKYPNRSAIIVTHAYLYSDETLYDHTTRSDQSWNPHSYWTAKLPGGTNDGREIWEKLVSKHANVAFVFCGHVLNDGAGRLTSAGANGNAVHQILANYQTRPRGGEGYLRLVEFLPDGKTVHVKSYSPLLDEYLTDEQQQFALDLPPAPSDK